MVNSLGTLKVETANSNNVSVLLPQQYNCSQVLTVWPSDYCRLFVLLVDISGGSQGELG
jgi:hypothetical protein